MASNTTILGAPNGAQYALSVSWSENSTSVSNNTSNITTTATLRPNRGGDAFWVSGAGILRVYWHDNKDNSDRLISEIGVDELGYNTGEQKASGGFNATHKDDGTLRGYAFATWERTNSYGGYAPLSGRIDTEEQALTTIARKSMPSVSAQEISIPASTGTLTINTNRKSNTFTHMITLSIGDTQILQRTNIGDKLELNINDIDDLILAQIPNANSATVKVKCTTYNGATNIGDNEVTFTAKVNDGAAPTFTDFSFSDTNSTTTAVTNNNQVLISGESTLTATISTSQKATAKYSATMSNYTFTINAQTFTENYSTSAISKSLGSVALDSSITANTTKDLVVSAIDSRGKSTSVSKQVTIVPYFQPIVNASATRQNGFENTTTIKIGGTVSRIEVAGTAKNTVNSTNGVQYRYKATNTTTWGSWTNRASTLDTATGKVTTSDFTLNLDNQTAYDFEVKITDRLKTTTASFQVAVGQPAFWVGEDGRVSVGGMPTQNKSTGDTGLLEVHGKVHARIGDYGTNLGPADDTPAGWEGIVGGGYTRVWYSGQKKFTNQPANWGWMEIYRYGSDFHMIFTEQSSGVKYVRSGNAGGWNSKYPNGKFARLMTLDNVYPVGSIFISATHSTASAVASALGGGTWEAWGQGRVMLGMGNNGTTNYTTAQQTGGSESTNHALYRPPINSTNSQKANKAYIDYVNARVGSWLTSGSSSNLTLDTITASVAGAITGDGGERTETEAGYFKYQSDNRQPYITCYFWKRTA